MLDPNPIVFGYTVALRDPSTALDDLHFYPPSSYKEERANAWIESKKEFLPWSKVAGSIQTVVAYDIRKCLGFRANSPEDKPTYASVEFAKWLLATYPDAFPVYAGDFTKPKVAFYGFDPKFFLRVMGINAIREGEQVPTGLWYNNTDCFDPKEMMLETELKQIVPTSKLLREAPGGEIPVSLGYTEHNNAEEDARIAIELCLRYQLFKLHAVHNITSNLEQFFATTLTMDDDDKRKKEAVIAS